MGGPGLTVVQARGRPHRGGAEAVEREHQKGARGEGRRPELGRSVATVRREGGRGGAAGRLLDLPPEWSIAWPAGRGSEGRR
jgi:hypothetical protein